MTEFLLIFVAGILGSSHCIGMCGPLAIALGIPSPNLVHNFQRQLLFSIGRLNTYGFIGALSAFAGVWLESWLWFGVSLQGLVAVVGGALLVILGLTSVGVVPRLNMSRFGPRSCAAAGWLKTLLRDPSPLSAFLAGVFTGFIPCGLVYGFLAVATASGNVIRGWLIMTAFGLGTMPTLVLTGCGATMLSVQSRARVLKIAAWCVVATGVISIARGAGNLAANSGAQVPPCPFCHQTSATALKK
jgi:sulfite exporter TauE/SafE